MVKDGSGAVATVANSHLHYAMAVYGSCHCGKVRMELPNAPAWVADCNCSLCRRLAWRVAYFPPDQVRISGKTTPYVWGDRMIGIHHCPTCGCGTHWQSLGQDFGKMGVNARLLDECGKRDTVLQSGWRPCGLERPDTVDPH